MTVADLLHTAPGAASALIEIAAREVVYAAVLFVIVLALTRLLRGAAPSLRQALWGLVLLRLVLPVDLASPLSLRGVAALGLPIPAAFEGGAARPGSTLAPSAPRSSLAFRAGTASGAPWQLYVVGAWLAGATLLGVGLYRRRRRYLAIVRGGEPVSDERALATFERWRRELGLRRWLSPVTSNALHAPFTVGAIRPVVFLPRTVLEHPDPSVLETVIAHELAHIKRWDDLTLKLQLVISALYFFNPVAWLAAAAMRRESERACDELVLARGILSPATYGRSIVAVLRLGLAGGPAHAPGLAGRLEREKKRLETIMKMRHASPRRIRSLYPLPVAAALAAFLLPMADGAPRPEPAIAGEHVVEGPGAPRAGSHAMPRQVALSNPMPGARVTARYGPLRNPFTGEPSDHAGIDIAGPTDARVLAPADGTVEQATTEYEGGAAYGTVLIIDHGSGVKTLFAHLGRLTVETGEWVKRGQQVALQGATGKVTGPHVHFEVWIDGENRNPAELVADWR